MKFKLRHYPVLHPVDDSKQLEHVTGREMIPMTLGSLSAWPWRAGPGAALNIAASRVDASGHELMVRSVGANDGLSARGTQVLDGQSAQDGQDRQDGHHDLLTSYPAGHQGMYLGPAQTVPAAPGSASPVHWQTHDVR